MTIEERAREAAGNWKSFESFGWFGRPDDADQWAIFYTHHRDSGILDESNTESIKKVMNEFEEDAVEESHRHWAVGHVDGWSIRVYRDGQITPAFRAWCEIEDQLESYPVLDEEDYSQREYEATMANLESELGRVWSSRRDDDMPEGLACDVYGWLGDHDPGAIESSSDQGGYPSEEEIGAALDALGYPEVEDAGV